MKLFRSKLFRLIMIILITIGLFTFQLYIEKEASNVDITKTIYQVNKELEPKHQIKSSDLMTLEVSQLQLPDGYITDPNEVIGKYTILPVTKGSFILSNNVTDEKNFEDSLIPDGYSMISIPLSIDQAAGWKINKNQVVDMVFSPNQYDNSLGANIPTGTEVATTSVLKTLYTNQTIEDVTVIDVINEALVSVDNDDFAGVPKYVVILAKNADAEFIVLAKDKGRFDLLVKNN